MLRNGQVRFGALAGYVEVCAERGTLLSAIKRGRSTAARP